MPARNAAVKKWVHHEISKAVNKLKQGHSPTPKQSNKANAELDHVFHRGDEIARIGNGKHKKKKAAPNGNDKSNDRPRGEYLHEVIEKDKLEGLQPLDGGRECCCFADCEYTIIPGSFKNVLLQCSSGCYMRYHNDQSDGCWAAVKKMYKKLNNGRGVDYSQKCIKTNCKGRIVSIVHCVGFNVTNDAKNDEFDDEDLDNECNEDDEGDDDIDVDANDEHFDLKSMKEPPSGFDVFCKELSMNDKSNALRPRVFEAKWRALSKPKRMRYDDRAKLLQFKWIRMKHKEHALDYAFNDNDNLSSSDDHHPRNDHHNASSSDEHQPTAHSQNDHNDQEKRKKLLAQQRQKRIEDMISQNPNIYDVEEMQRKKREKEREEHRRKTEKLLNLKKKKKKKLKNKRKSKTKNSTVSLSALNDIADQWASEKPLRSPSITPSHKSNDHFYESSSHQPSLSDAHHQSESNQPQQPLQQEEDPALNGHVPQPQLNPPTSKLQQWVSLAKQPKFNAMAAVPNNLPKQSEVNMEKEKEKQQAQQHKMRQKQKMRSKIKVKAKEVPMPKPKAQGVKMEPVATSWEELKESIVCGDRIFSEIPCSSKCSPYILVSTSSILQEWSDRLEDFHRWCTQYGLCRFLPISQCANRDNPSEASNRAVILEFSFVTKAKIARERLMVKLGRRDIEFVQWRFGHAYFFKHSYVKLNEEIIMTGKEFKRLDQMFKSESKAQKQTQRQRAPPPQQQQLMRPWEAYPSLALPADYNNVSMSELSESSYSQYESSYISSTEYEEDDEDEDDEDEGEHALMAAEVVNSSQQPPQMQHHQDGNKIIYNGRTLYIGDIVYMSLYPHVPFIIHKNIGNGFVEILKPDNSKESVEISSLQNALSFPSLHQDTKNENELRFRQSLLEDLSECQLDYLLVCME